MIFKKIKNILKKYKLDLNLNKISFYYLTVKRDFYLNFIEILNYIIYTKKAKIDFKKISFAIVDFLVSQILELKFLFKLMIIIEPVGNYIVCGIKQFIKTYKIIRTEKEAKTLKKLKRDKNRRLGFPNKSLSVLKEKKKN